MKTTITLLATLALAGCVTQPSADELRHADYGEFPSAFRAIIKDYYSANLKDPDSAIYKSFSDASTAWFQTVGGPSMYGYKVCVTLNAKNSYGGYIGYHTDAFLIRNREVILYIKDGVFGGRNVC